MEFFDGTSFACKVGQAFTIISDEKDCDAPADEKLGEERMGSEDIFTNFGVTMMFSLVGLLLMIVILVIVTLFCRKKLSEKN